MTTPADENARARQVIYQETFSTRAGRETWRDLQAIFGHGYKSPDVVSNHALLAQAVGEEGVIQHIRAALEASIADPTDDEAATILTEGDPYA